MKYFRTILLLVCIPFSAAGDANDLVSTDFEVVATFPEISFRVATSIGRPDLNGLLGRNRDWGDLYSVRFQYGAGRALRHGLASGDETLMRLARSAIGAGLNSIEPDGAFPASLPKSLFPNTVPGPSDQASAAAFFLSDVCPALMMAGPEPIEIGQVRAAMDWLRLRQDLLLRRDEIAPNRLLVNALAYGSCGALLDDETVRAQADPFLRAALELVTENGIFLEAGGSDTSYQSVAIVVGLEIAILEVAGPHQQRLEHSLRRAHHWLTTRIEPNGRLDSSQNTRTCAEETFLGRAKDVDLREVFRALAYSAVALNDETDAATRFATWLRTEPAPCANLID